MINTIKFINTLDIQGIKFHSLLILEHTKLGKMYKENPFKVLTLEEYVDIVTTQITYLRDDIIIHRLAADGVFSDLIEPKWTIKKMVVMDEIDKRMRQLNLYQGDHFNK
jgi:radical SAM superfamily enzyme